MESTLNAEGFESLDANMSAKSRISVSTEEELGNSMERKDADDDFGEPVNLSQAGGGGKLRAWKLKKQMMALSLRVTFGSCRSPIYGLGGFYFHLTEDGPNYVMKPDDEEDHAVYFNNAPPSLRMGGSKFLPCLHADFCPLTKQSVVAKSMSLWNEVDDQWASSEL
nr:uncharacterized protein LOC113717685 isoform X2 [Coffea arabica]XP_027098273.1 uncharacterized protein LOC113717685 isoform X2 [Coffea arabica]